MAIAQDARPLQLAIRAASSHAWVGPHHRTAVTTWESAMTHAKKDDVATNVGMPRDLRLKLDEVRLARARRGRCRPPTVKDLVREALVELVERESHT